MADVGPDIWLPSLPGAFFVFDGVGYRVARLQAVWSRGRQRLRITTAIGEEVGFKDIEVVGSIVAHWAWM